ncbi:MAG: fructose-6-phosphate aldolase [Rickettsiales bacterium]|nr:fructose-6-phosphate aldolase [Rickettsiales bacterium]|tara:strand:- start:194 stop:850 length:657 start_codon:yes stop_codon:yes gene_type:complete
MKFFIDTADINQIEEINSLGLVDGVTTNPSLIYKSGRDFKKVISDISKIVTGPISAEVTTKNFEDMVSQGLELAKIAHNIVVKVPLTEQGLRACKELSNRNIKVNVTLCFSSSQALLAAKMGASYISPFIGRLDDISHDGLDLIRDIVKIYQNFKDYIKTQVLVASIRSPLQISKTALMGAHVATIPPKIIKQMINHPLTDIGLESFMKDWGKTGQKF